MPSLICYDQEMGFRLKIQLVVTTHKTLLHCRVGFASNVILASQPGPHAHAVPLQVKLTLW